jgi:nickel-dependent lactate racemase
MRSIPLNYRAIDDVVIEVRDENLLAVLEPKETVALSSLEGELRKGLGFPIGCVPLRVLATGRRNAMILTDDYTRLTPSGRIIPVLLDELNSAGIPDECIMVMVAQGTHRPMTEAELEKKLGRAVLTRVKVLPHEFGNPQALRYLGKTPNGTEIWINKKVLESDLVIGVANILPHGYAGFSGGAKIIQPGVSGTVTTGQTHWLSVNNGLHIGNPDNPIRREMEQVADTVGLHFIVNTVMNLKGEVVAVVCGDHRKAFLTGARIAKTIFSAEFPAEADIVVVDSYPHIFNIWQGGRGLYTGRMAVKAGGTILLACPCPEGWADEPRFYELLCLTRDEIIRRVDAGEERDLFIATPAANVLQVRDACDIVLVTEGIPREEVTRVGFRFAENVQRGLEMALEKQGPKAAVTVMRFGGDLIPIPSR